MLFLTRGLGLTSLEVVYYLCPQTDIFDVVAAVSLSALSILS